MPQTHFNLILQILFFVLIQACAKNATHMPIDPQVKPGNTGGIKSPIPIENPTTNPNEPSPTSPNNSSNPNSAERPAPTSCVITKEYHFEVGYEENIIPIIERACKMCHGQSSAFNWMNYETFATAKDRIINRVFVQKNMPIAGMSQLTDEESAQLKLWLETGTPKNQKEIEQMACPNPQ